MLTEKGPWFFTSDTAKPRDRSKIISVKTGVSGVDRLIIGLNKKEISVFSGFRAAGKSTILTQIALQVANEGKRAALFSGEMHESKVFEWTYLICAGRTYTYPTDFENYYKINPEALPIMQNWLRQKMFVYNNAYGNKYELLFNAMKDCIETKRTDVIILDNLMSIDIGASDSNKNSKQTEFIWQLKGFAEQNDVHIVLVAHPRKTMGGILRIDDISGTADLTNAADNVFLLHRVSFDFKRNAKAMFRWGDDHELLQYDNIIEIAKNRDLGRCDDMIGLYFDKASKQMTCDGQEIVYGWRNAVR